MTMAVIQWLTPAVVGGFIGYITNWLAIKMLFRPYTEKRFGPIKIPFTPGLIPKEQHRIAHSVGQTIGEHLLTPEILTNALEGPQVQEQLGKKVRQLILHLQQDEMTLQTWLEKRIGKDVDSVFIKWEAKIIHQIGEELRNPEVQKQIASWILDQVMEQLKKPEMEQMFQKIQEQLLKSGHEYFNREQTRLAFNQWIQKKVEKWEKKQRSISDFLSLSMLQEMEAYLLMQGPTLSFYVQKIFYQPTVQNNLKQLLTQILQNQLGKFAAFFVNPDKIYQRFLDEIEKYLNKEENQEELLQEINHFLKKGLKTPVSSLLQKIPPSLKETGLEQGYHYLTDKIFTSFLSVSYWNESFLQQQKDSILPWITRGVGYLSHSETFYKKCQFLIAQCRKEVLQYPIYHLFRKIKPIELEKIQDKIVEGYLQLVREKGTSLIQFLNLPQMVEDQIQSFDMAYTEKIILSIAKKELQAITWLGALLGFIMGIVLNFI